MNKPLKQKLVATLTALSLSTVALSSVAVFANTDNSTTTTGTSVTLSQAKKKALSEAKSGQVIGYEQKNKHNKSVFEIIILDGQNEKEIKIDGQTGKVLKSKTKDLSKEDDDKALINATPKIDLAKAESLVKEKYPNATIEDLKLDAENNTLVYEVSVREGKKEIEVTLDANTGSFGQEDVETKSKSSD